VKRCAILLLSVAGCAPDLCDFPELKSDTCITVHLAGTLAPAEKSFDALQVDVIYNQSSDNFARRLTPQRLMPGTMPATLPAVFGVVYPTGVVPTNTGHIAVLATSGGRPVGYVAKALSTPAIKVGEHAHLTLELADPSKSHCFDGIEQFDESDVDCGGDDCPLCASGKKCEAFSNGTRDCASGVCMNAVSGGQDRCQ
jgi:hypothetical protein